MSSLSYFKEKNLLMLRVINPKKRPTISITLQ